MGNQVAHSSHAAPPALLVRTVRNTHRLNSGQEYRIGRDDRADIPLVDARVSWEHAVIRQEGQSWVLEDLGSLNGTFVGAERITRLEINGPYAVHFGHPEDGPVLRFEFERPGPPPDLGRKPTPASGDTTFMPGVLRDPTSKVRIQSKVMKIGRRPDNDIVVSDLGVSKQHAELRVTPTGRTKLGMRPPGRVGMRSPGRGSTRGIRWGWRRTRRCWTRGCASPRRARPANSCR